MDLQAVVESALETSRHFIESQAHELTVSLTGEPITLDGDAMHLAQVLTSLLTNAARYTPRGGHVEILTERSDTEAVIMVRDNGIGIEQSRLADIFGMFSQIDRTLERAQGGLGIGLTLARRLVELHGGSIEARSRGLGTGSEFVVRLPMSAAHPPARTAVWQRADSRELTDKKKRVLIVDDNLDSADSLAILLRHLGHDVKTAFDGVDAVESAASFRPDVMLLDIGLPKLNGYEVARRVRAQPEGNQMLLVALTGWGQEEDVRRSMEAGFDLHVVKPVSMIELRKIMSGPDRPRGGDAPDSRLTH